MEAKYFNKWEFCQAFYLSETNPLEAKLLYEKYLENYPKDYHAYTYYISLLVTLNELETAEKLLNYVEIKYKKDNVINKYDNRIHELEKSIFYVKLRLLSYQEKYDELYNICYNNKDKIKSMELNSVWFYSKQKNNKLNIEKRNINSYLFRQIVKYEESDFLNHIQKHLAEYNEKSETPNVSVFERNFPIYEVIEEVKKYIPSDKKILTGFYDNIYVFKYNECGRENYKLVDYFKVITLHNSKDFITMCPSSGCENLPYIDLNYLNNKNKEPEQNKVKRLSQIDKFNQRYKK